MKFLNNTFLRSDFSAQPLSKWNNFSYYRKRCTTTINPPPHDPTRLAIHWILRLEDDLISNCGPNVKKTVSFDDVVHFIEEENMMTYVDFDCGFTFFPETPTKVRQINRERNYISRSFEKPQYIPSNDQHTCSVDEQNSSNIFLNPYNLWDMLPATLMSLNRTNFTYSMFNQCPQPTTQQPRTDSYPVFSSLRTMESKKKGLRVSFAFFQITYRTDEWTKQLLRLKTWVISGSPEQWMEFHRLWSTVIVFKCSYLFQLFDFYCLMVRYLLFSENLLFSFLWWLWGVKAHWQLLCKVTLP